MASSGWWCVVAETGVQDANAIKDIFRIIIIIIIYDS
jgi:hypothetical protein